MSYFLHPSVFYVFNSEALAVCNNALLQGSPTKSSDHMGRRFETSLIGAASQQSESKLLDAAI